MNGLTCWHLNGHAGVDNVLMADQRLLAEFVSQIEMTPSRDGIKQFLENLCTPGQNVPLAKNARHAISAP